MPPLAEGLAAAEAVVADHRQVVQPRAQQPLLFVGGIADGVGERLVLFANRIHEPAYLHVVLLPDNKRREEP